MINCRSFLVALVAAFVFTSPAFANENQAVRDALAHEIESHLQGVPFSIDESDIAAGNLLAEFYVQRDYAPAWTNNIRHVDDLLKAIEASYDEGLNPADYHVEKVRAIHAAFRSRRMLPPSELANADLLLSDSLIRLVYHQRFGKVNAATLDANWNFRHQVDGKDPLEVVQHAVAASSLSAYLDKTFERPWLYRRLKDGLATYRNIQAEGGWPSVPDGETLKPGVTDERLRVLGERLIVEGDLDKSWLRSSDYTYDSVLEAAVRRFQERHAIDADGAVGPGTLAELNVPVEQRIEQLRINLERGRWVLTDVPKDLVLVNIAAFHAFVIRDRQYIWDTNVVVGKHHHESPVFRDEMRYIVFNPTWTIPRGIAIRETLPHIKRDPDYLASHNFDLKDSSGKVVDPSRIDWSTVNGSNFRYTVVQRPGPNNSLGQVKFIFPNEHSVYLHDTPSKALFSRTERAFSHGCIRVQNPMTLAKVLLGEEWTDERISGVLDTGEITRVYLPEPLPVFLMYWTAEVSENGTMHFYQDVYSRDGRVGALLDAPFAISVDDTV